ncbi:MAG: phycobilisome linker polypeptide, partial [Snowella sp.]
KVRRSNKAVIVPYEQLNNTLQQVYKMGGKVASITPASMNSIGKREKGYLNIF